MKKILFVLVVIVGFVASLTSDVYSYYTTLDAINKAQLNFRKSNMVVNEEEIIKLDVLIIGNLPPKYSKIIIFADNRYLELMTQSNNQENVIKYEGTRAGGFESVFALSPNSNDHLTVYYTKKNFNKNTSPLIYAFIEADIDRFILSDKTIKSRIFSPFE
ncbi:hypothetical protein HN020_00540 [Brevibacillus borstelensis]|jgi:hypothetical protein|uniref:hypothetical protein n=1 Tax=Brevibacillus borstelensis TaxID=45462 RepID=UPI00046A8D66|nr:hypothetical protein [Brevibacillus borstelensis]MCC0564584.1 hypothetical protein [Brevibacillus borstelensis]MCM3470497.1 hypothetical protein [Brevibacillus borstelensis]MCM3558051.1 hypothetical protein [Brevibacillus borstelensis]MCM3592934.1 hypothetical protein [Brevibacillus borstelensis]MED1853309.1 hypothetical protein [Brevibacillus borstelensis]